MTLIANPDAYTGIGVNAVRAPASYRVRTGGYSDRCGWDTK